MKINHLASLFFLCALFLFNCEQETNNSSSQTETEEEMEELIEEETEVACNTSSAGQSVSAISNGVFEAEFTSETLNVDGCGNEAAWQSAPWYDLNYTWMGTAPDNEDYQGKFKMLWDANSLYLFVEVVDDSLHATLTDGVENYWKGDYVEIFLDEDQSGGNHQYNHQAFAYHVSTEGHAIDKDTNEATVFFDDHVEVMRTRDGTTHYWEMAIKLFDKDFDEASSENVAIMLTKDKQIGFSLAYGDNDGNQSRENFMGSRETHGVNNDEGYINSDVFGSVTLVE